MSRATPAPEKDAQLLAIGAQCSEASCLLVDFLPFKCQHCQLRFCADHFRVEAHRCEKYDESKFNRVAPSCPLCNEPVAIQPDQDPNIQMDRHISTQCTVATGKTKVKSSPVCAKGKCRKVLFAPIKCDRCKQQFCAEHRFPADHACAGLAASPAAPSQPSVMVSNALNSGKTTFYALKKTLASTSTTPAASLSASPATKPVTAPKSNAPALVSTISNPFSKSDRRAKQERESRRKAMMERAKKGLLTEQEKKLLEEEENRPKGTKPAECVIM